MTTDPFTVDLDLVMALGRRVLEASMRAIPAIYRNCSIPSVALEVQFNPVVFREALDLVEFAFATTTSRAALSWLKMVRH